MMKIKLGSFKDALRDGFESIEYIFENTFENITELKMKKGIFEWMYAVSWLSALLFYFFLCFVPASVFSTSILCCSGIGLMLPFLRGFYRLFMNFPEEDPSMMDFARFCYCSLSFTLGVCAILWPFHLISPVALGILCAFHLIVPLFVAAGCAIAFPTLLIVVIVCGFFSLNPSNQEPRDYLMPGLQFLAFVGGTLLFLLMPIALVPAVFFSLSPVAMIVIDLLCSFSIISILVYIGLRLWVFSDVNGKQQSKGWKLNSESFKDFVRSLFQFDIRNKLKLSRASMGSTLKNLDFKKFKKCLTDYFEDMPFTEWRWDYLVSWFSGLVFLFFLCFVPASVFSTSILCCSGIGLMLPFLHEFYQLFVDFDRFIKDIGDNKMYSFGCFCYCLLSFISGVSAILWPFHLISRVALIVVCVFDLIVPSFLALTCAIMFSGCLICAIVYGFFSLNPGNKSIRGYFGIYLYGMAFSGVPLLFFGMPIALAPAALFSLSPVAVIVIDLLCSFSIVGTLVYIVFRLWTDRSSSDVNKQQTSHVVKGDKFLELLVEKELKNSLDPSKEGELNDRYKELVSNGYGL